MWALIGEVLLFGFAGWCLRWIVEGRRRAEQQVEQRVARERAWREGYEVGFRHAFLGAGDDADQAFLKAAGVKWEGGSEDGH